MSGIDINNLFKNLQNPRQIFIQKNSAPVNQNISAQTSSSTASSTPTSPQQAPQAPAQNTQMNTLKSIDRAIYTKDLMNMPKNINEFIYMQQKGLNLAQFNRMFSQGLLMQRNSLSQMQAQILAQLQDLNTTEIQEFIKTQLKTQTQAAIKNLEISSNGMINLLQISEMVQKNGKEALAKLIMTMTEASKSGITDLTQMKDMAKLINASIAIASENDPVKNLKLLLMLYLPWLPLKDGVGFDLEVEVTGSESQNGNSILNVTITTVNYGLVNATLYLETTNSVQTMIECSENFPKDELLERLNTDKKNYSMNTVTTVEVKKNIESKVKKATASINTGKITEISPYLLLMAHSIIKHTIDIDNNAGLG